MSDDERRPVIVLTIDQRGSRGGPDRVADLLGNLAPLASELTFRRTAGDEVQGLVTHSAHLPPLLEVVLREGGWRTGVGIGSVESPLPGDVREARGSAFVHAREAVEAARTVPGGVRVVAGADTADQEAAARALEGAVWLWAALLQRRTDRGWEVADLLDAGHTHEQAAQRLGISQSAVTQRARAAGIVEGGRARDLVAHLADLALHACSPTLGQGRA